MLSHPIISHPIHMANSYHGVITKRRIHPILMGDSPPIDVGENFDPQTPSLNSIP